MFAALWVHAPRPLLAPVGGNANCGNLLKLLQLTQRVGAWRSLVARLLWEQEAPGSNPGAPTNKFRGRSQPAVGPFSLVCKQCANISGISSRNTLGHAHRRNTTRWLGNVATVGAGTTRAAEESAGSSYASMSGVAWSGSWQRRRMPSHARARGGRHRSGENVAFVSRQPARAAGASRTQSTRSRGVRSSSLGIISTIEGSGEECVSRALAKASDDELTEFLQKASSGDRSVLPELRRLLDQGPELRQIFGDLGHLAKTAWIDLATGDNLLRREALTRQVAALEREIAGPSPSVLERLMAERIVVCWLELNCLDPALSRTREMPLRQAEFYDRRRDP